MTKFFYFHAESGTLWSSDQDLEEEGNPDGLTEPISKETAFKLMKELEMKEIPHYEHKTKQSTGFFRRKSNPTEEIIKPKTRKQADKEPSCSACGLYKDCNSPRMKPYGNFKKKIMVVGEAPGEVEDERGMPFQGRTGKLLQRMFRHLGTDLFDDCVCINAAQCRPIDTKGNNRPPTNTEMFHCRRRVLLFIEQYKPKVIILLGNSAVFSLIGDRWKKDLGTITKWRGWTIPDQDFGCWLCPTFHPSFIERSKEKARGDSVEEVIWQQDLRQAFDFANVGLFPVYKEPEIEIIEDLSLLNYSTAHSSIFGDTKFRDVPKVVAIDYETTGLKPHTLGHEIICASVANSPDHVYAFMMPNTRAGRRPFVNMLADPNIKKYAHNMKFEESWSVNILKQPVEGWDWDSMQMAHELDNRAGITSLKFQTYVNFGVVDYASEITPYLEGDKEDANSFNRIKELLELPDGKEKLLKYNALDSIFEFRLVMRQQTLINMNKYK